MIATLIGAVIVIALAIWVYRDASRRRLAGSDIRPLPWALAVVLFAIVFFPAYLIFRPPPPIAKAGWYPNPDGGATRRYWDGQRWTEHTRPSRHRGKTIALATGSFVVLLAITLIVIGIAVDDQSDNTPTASDVMPSSLASSLRADTPSDSFRWELVTCDQLTDPDYLRQASRYGAAQFTGAAAKSFSDQMIARAVRTALTQACRGARGNYAPMDEATEAAAEKLVGGAG
jgi:hypothetical protein